MNRSNINWNLKNETTIYKISCSLRVVFFLSKRMNIVNKMVHKNSIYWIWVAMTFQIPRCYLDVLTSLYDIKLLTSHKESVSKRNEHIPRWNLQVTNNFMQITLKAFALNRRVRNCQMHICKTIGIYFPLRTGLFLVLWWVSCIGAGSPLWRPVFPSVVCHYVSVARNISTVIMEFPNCGRFSGPFKSKFLANLNQYLNFIYCLISPFFFFF